MLLLALSISNLLDVEWVLENKLLLVYLIYFYWTDGDGYCKYEWVVWLELDPFPCILINLFTYPEEPPLIVLISSKRLSYYCSAT